MSILTKTIVVFAIGASAILPAAADAVIGSTYAKEQMERYMPNVRSTAARQDAHREIAAPFFLQHRAIAPALGGRPDSLVGG